MREVDIMSTFGHRNILSLKGVVLREGNNSPWMVFEYMPYGDLAEVLRSNSRQLRSAKPGLQPLTPVNYHIFPFIFTDRFTYSTFTACNQLSDRIQQILFNRVKQLIVTILRVPGIIALDNDTDCGWNDISVGSKIRSSGSGLQKLPGWLGSHS